ncbi:hypothetical protein Pmani_038674 [Petrolisthes manimaculis]|uniref:Uncharacterized protein n=1 Tax=Petrolisthes manimaculis TaxID=1843537 RepID=A0AAE1TM35_9EUCA|nr:hypothetical protein Pmani_038674 [Petrolisthes manimaculis]
MAREWCTVCKGVVVVAGSKGKQGGVLPKKCQAESRNPSSETWARVTSEPHINMPVDKPTGARLWCHTGDVEPNVESHINL